jgi:hypothetical protein
VSYGSLTYDLLKGAYGRVKHSTAGSGGAVAHRSGLTAADLLAAPGTVTTSKRAGGSATAGVYTVYVVARSRYGRTTVTAGSGTVTTETTNLTIRAAFAAVSHATSYDIYCSTDGAAAKYVGTITEAQRASGIKITAYNTTGAGGAAGAVDVEVPGTGGAANHASLAQNTAFDLTGITEFDPDGAQNVDVNVVFSVTDGGTGTLVLLPFYLGLNGLYYAGAAVTVTIGGATGVYLPQRQTVRLAAQGRPVVVAVASITGTGASVDLEAVAA